MHAEEDDLEVVTQASREDLTAPGGGIETIQTTLFDRQSCRFLLAVILGKKLQVVLILVINAEMHNVVAIVFNTSQHQLERVFAQRVAGKQIDRLITVAIELPG